jgi:hypothetical protein
MGYYCGSLLMKIRVVEIPCLQGYTETSTDCCIKKAYKTVSEILK